MLKVGGALSGAAALGIAFGVLSAERPEPGDDVYTSTQQHEATPTPETSPASPAGTETSPKKKPKTPSHSASSGNREDDALETVLACAENMPATTSATPTPMPVTPETDTTPSPLPPYDKKADPCAEGTQQDPEKGIKLIRKMRANDTSVYWSEDKKYYASDWFPGFAGQIMIDFGCAEAPYYDPDPACPDGQGVHRAIDIYLDCGTPLVAARPAEVVPADVPNAPGPAYGSNGLRLKTTDDAGQPIDVIIGHASDVTVKPGEQVAPGQPLAKASSNGAPDGCHLHFEVRPQGGDPVSAGDPRAVLALTEIKKEVTAP